MEKITAKILLKEKNSFHLLKLWKLIILVILDIK